MISEFDSQVADLHSLVTSLQRWWLMSYICSASDMSDHCHAQRHKGKCNHSSKIIKIITPFSHHKLSQAITSHLQLLLAPLKRKKMHSATHLQFRVVDSRAWIQVLVYRPILAVVRHKESQVHDLRHRQRPQRDHRAGISGSDTLWLAHVLCCGHAQVWQISGDEIIRGMKNMVSLGIESLIHSMCMSKFLQNSYGRMEPTTAHNSTFPRPRGTEVWWDPLILPYCSIAYRTLIALFNTPCLQRL